MTFDFATIRMLIDEGLIVRWVKDGCDLTHMHTDGSKLHAAMRTMTDHWRERDRRISEAMGSFQLIATVPKEKR